MPSKIKACLVSNNKSYELREEVCKPHIVGTIQYVCKSHAKLTAQYYWHVRIFHVEIYGTVIAMQV